MGASIFCQAKNDSSWGSGVSCKPPGPKGNALVKMSVQNPQTLKYAKTVIVRVNTG